MLTFAEAWAKHVELRGVMATEDISRQFIPDYEEAHGRMVTVLEYTDSASLEADRFLVGVTVGLIMAEGEVKIEATFIVNREGQVRQFSSPKPHPSRRNRSRRMRS